MSVFTFLPPHTRRIFRMPFFLAVFFLMKNVYSIEDHKLKGDLQAWETSASFDCVRKFMALCKYAEC